MNLFEGYLAKYKGNIDRRLTEYLESWYSQSFNKGEHLDYLKAPFLEAFRGGKRIRGSLVCLGFELYNTGFNEAILMPAIAYEIFQTTILLQDDVIDKSPQRRGQDSFHIKLGGDHNAISNTICFGDIGFSLPSEIIAKSDFDDSVKVKALRTFCNSMTNTIIGEILDINLPAAGNNVSEKDIIEVAYAKTAHYTVIGPLTLGAVLAGAADEKLKALYDFGKHLGIAFQIKDDIIGIFGDERVTGKSATSDMEEKKITLLYYFANANSSTYAKKTLNILYGSKNISPDQANTIREILTQSGAVAYAENKMQYYADEAYKCIDNLTNDIGMKSILTDFTNYMIKRNY